MKINEFIKKISFYISVPKCVSCGTRLLYNDTALCGACLKEYNNVLNFNCSLCAKPFMNCECTNKYLKAHYVHKVFKVFKYFPEEELPSNMLIYSLKRHNRTDVTDFLSNEIYKSILNKNISHDNLIITNVPRRKKSVKKYGYDHSGLLAKGIAKRLGVSYIPLLISLAKKDQKKNKSREERIKNAEFDYRSKIPDITGCNVIIVDDIITTGASVSACAALIHGLGAKRIYAAAVSIAYKDDYTPFIKNKPL